MNVKDGCRIKWFCTNYIWAMERLEPIRQSAPKNIRHSCRRPAGITLWKIEEGVPQESVLSKD